MYNNIIKYKYILFIIAFGANVDHLERYKRQFDDDELLNLSPEELCKDRVSEEYFRLTTEGDCRDVVRYRFSKDAIINNDHC